MDEVDDTVLVYAPFQMDSDEDSEDDLVEATMYGYYTVVTDDSVESTDRKKRTKRVEYVRIDMEAFMLQYINDPSFDVTIRMDRVTFKYLISLLEPALLVDDKMASSRGGAITPDMCVYLTLRYLAGGSFHDIKIHLGISKASFYRCLHKTLYAICNHSALLVRFPTTIRELEIISNGFENVSSNSSITNCVGAIDGYLLSINTPSRSEVGNVKAYFSGHYQKYGINVQAVADSNCKFLYFELSGPGSSNDRAAIFHKIEGIALHDIIENLPGEFVVIADAAYKATEHVAPIFYGTQRQNKANDNFNYAASQCRIRVEMAFGIMQAKWRILRRPLETRFCNHRLVAKSIACLHNFVLKEQHGDDLLSLRRSVVPDDIETSVANVFDDPQFPIPPIEDLAMYRSTQLQTSIIRQAMVQQVAFAGVQRPIHSMVGIRNVEIGNDTL
jgi:hypothetical protein